MRKGVEWRASYGYELCEAFCVIVDMALLCHAAGQVLERRAVGASSRSWAVTGMSGLA